MELAQLRYFLAVAEEENLSAAARRLYLSQPALSRAIAHLEAELGVQLFDRSSNRIVLNENGRQFAHYLGRAEQELDNGVRSMRRQLSAETGDIAMSTSTHGVLSQPLTAYLLAHPALHLRQYIQSARQMQEMLLAREIDFAITSARFSVPEIRWEPLLHDEFLVYVHEDHPLAGRREVEFAALARERLIFYDYGLETTDILNELCAQAGFSPDLYFAGNETEVPFELLSKNLGVFLVPASMHYFHMSTAPSPRRGPVCVLRLAAPRRPFTLGAAMLRGRVPSPAVAGFWDYLRTYFAARDRELAESLARDYPA